jgi:metal-responsive CopG/Arc/MetJ family transcriptional regulator
MSAKKKEDDESRKERVIFLVTKKELEAIDEFANENYFGNRSMVIRQALIDFGLLKKSPK